MYPGVLDDIERLFPAARITSGYRGPSHPLTRRNPSSAHAHGNPNNPGAVDVAPIPGVSFGDYVSRLKAAGIPVTGALDEQAHPRPWTTGPNWHVSLDPRAPKAASHPPKEQPPMPAPQLPQPDLAGADAPLVNSAAILGNIPSIKKQTNWGEILRTVLGALSDGALVGSGAQAMFSPLESRRQSDDRQMQFEREKFAQMLESRRQDALAKASEPPQFVQNLQAFQAMPPDQKRALLQYQDATNPITVAGPQGTSFVPRTTVKSIGGKTYYNIGGEWFEEGQ